MKGLGRIAPPTSYVQKRRSTGLHTLHKINSDTVKTFYNLLKKTDAGKYTMSTNISCDSCTKQIYNKYNI